MAALEPPTGVVELSSASIRDRESSPARKYKPLIVFRFVSRFFHFRPWRQQLYAAAEVDYGQA